MENQSVLLEIDTTRTARITLNKPEIHNAFDDSLIAELIQVFKRLDHDASVGTVVLAANGKSFSAGADLNWMKRMAGYTQQENIGDAMQLSELMHTFNTLSKPTVVLVQGSALGGGVGLVACADIAIAAEKARFSLSETRLGLIPSVISPYVIDAIGARAARRYFLTAERFDAHEALRIGLIHEVVSTDALPAALENVLAVLRQCGPNAKAAAKEMIALVQRSPRDDALRRTTAERIAEIRASDEGREGVSAFLEKRSPAWYQE